MIPANHLFYLRYEKSSIFRCTCRILVNSFGSGNTHVGQTAKPKLNPHSCQAVLPQKHERALAATAHAHPFLQMGFQNVFRPMSVWKRRASQSATPLSGNRSATKTSVGAGTCGMTNTINTKIKYHATELQV